MAGPGYPDHGRRQLRLERDDRTGGARPAAAVRPAGGRAADRAGGHRGDGLAAPSGRHSDHGRRERFHPRRCVERAACPRGRRGQHLSGQERRNRRVDRDRRMWPRPRAFHVTWAATSSWASARPRCCIWRVRSRTSTAKHTRPTSWVRIITRATARGAAGPGFPGGARGTGRAGSGRAARRRPARAFSGRVSGQIRKA